MENEKCLSKIIRIMSEEDLVMNNEIFCQERQKIFLNCIKDPNFLIFIIQNCEEKVVGYIITRKNGEGETEVRDIDILNENERRKGYATEAILELITYISKIKNLDGTKYSNMLTFNIFEEKSVIISILEKMGATCENYKYSIKI